MTSPRARTRAPRILLSLGLLSGSLLSACGGGGLKTVDADDWVSDICDAGADFTEEQERVGEKFAAIDPSDKDAKKDTLAVFKEFAKVRDELDAARKKAGKPDVEGGDKVVEVFNKQAKKNDKQFDDFVKDIEKIDKDDFEDDFADLISDFELASISVLDDLEELAEDNDTEGAQEIIDLIEDDEDCAELYFDSDSAQEPSSSPTPSARATTTVRQTVTSGTAVARSTVRPNASTNEKWVGGLCAGVTSYVADLENLSSKLTIPANPSGQQIKDIMVTFLTDAQRRTAQLKSDVDKLGNPDVRDGAKIQAAMSAASGQVVTIFDGAVRDARALNASDQAKLGEQLTALGTRLTQASAGIEGAFAQIDRDFDTAALSRIADTIPECRGLF